MSSRNSLFLKWSKNQPLLKKIFLFYNIYIRNFKFFFKSAQFGEDKKIIKLFPKDKKGTYLDLGCFHPVRQNNTYLMHRKGWKGINIDLNPFTIDLFNMARPNAINICAAISGREESRTLYFDHSLSSLNTISRYHLLFLKKVFGLTKFEKNKIKTKTLPSLLKKNKIRKIDFMNIDIEDCELEVLRTINFKYFDIKVVCIEIIHYNFHSKRNKNNRIKIFNILKRNNYFLKFKTIVNYIFVKKN